jgi:hypothetical protein
MYLHWKLCINLLTTSYLYMLLVRVAQHGLAVSSVILRAGGGQLTRGKVCDVLILNYYHVEV